MENTSDSFMPRPLLFCLKSGRSVCYSVPDNSVTKNIPPDSVVMMSDLYRTPELKNHYCKYECPIGKNLPVATKESGLHGITIKILNSLDDEDVKRMKKSLLSIAADGEITPDEEEEFKAIVTRMEELEKVISELRMLAEKYQK